MLVSACGHQPAADKIAVIDWQKVMAAHPKQAQLQAAKDAYDSLVFSRRNQLTSSKTQLSALGRLQRLKQNSRYNFLAADANTKLAERETVEQDKLQKLYRQTVAQVQANLSAEDRQRGDEYKLRLVNLRLRYESLHLTKEQRSAIRQEIDQIEAERNQFRYHLAQKQQAEVARILEPARAEAKARMEAYAQELHGGMRQDMKQTLSQDQADLSVTPGQMKDLLASVDKELDNRQQLVEKLQDEIKKDVESIVMKLARQRGYTVVFHKYRVNVKADDLTQDVIKDLQNMK